VAQLGQGQVGEALAELLEVLPQDLAERQVLQRGAWRRNGFGTGRRLLRHRELAPVLGIVAVGLIVGVGLRWTSSLPVSVLSPLKARTIET
jgi:hypothetical protein